MILNGLSPVLGQTTKFGLIVATPLPSPWGTLGKIRNPMAVAMFLDVLHSHKTPYRRALASARPVLERVIVFSTILNVLMLTGSIYMLQVYDRVLSSGSVPTLMVLFGIVVVLFGFLGFYDFLRTRLLARAAMRVDDQLNTAAFHKWLGMGLPHAPDTQRTHVLQDLETLRNFLSGPVVCALVDVLFVPLFLLVLFLIHPWIGLLTIFGAGVGGVLAYLNRALTSSALRNGATLETAQRGFSDQSQRSAEAIHAMGMQSAITRHWQQLYRASLASHQRGQDPSEALAATSKAFRMLLQSAILTLGAFLVLRGEITAGMIIAGSILSGRALAPVDQLIGQWRTIGHMTAAHKRLSEVFEGDTKTPSYVTLPDPSGALSVTDLTKKASSRQQNGEPIKILSEVSFSLESGDALGVIGNSASGKSTLARLLVGAGQGDAGEVRLDGATLDQWHPDELGRHIGYLPQTLEMLPGTIRDNIARFDPDAPDADVIAAARLTGIHDMILKLPEGYNTPLGDPYGPAVLSGGQIQRLGLTRAIYGMPKIVVLDEPNANLDIAGDEALTKTIATLRKAGSTVIVMAHRPSVLSAVNKLMILSSGTVGAFGDRDTLLAEDYKAGARPAKSAKPAPTPPAMAPPRSPPVAASAAEPDTPADPALDKLPETTRTSGVKRHDSLALRARKKQIAQRAERTDATTFQPQVVRMAGPSRGNSRA